MTLLAAEGLSKRFGGVQAAKDVSFALDPGEMLAVIGPNGAGKSTAFNMVGGQLRPDSGRVSLAGRDITGLPPREVCRLGVGRTFQGAQTFLSFTVIGNVQMALIAHHGQTRRLLPEAMAMHRGVALALLDRVGMAAQAERPVGELAYGDVKRVELAIALAAAPRLLLMDEPTAGMAPSERIALMELTRSLVRARGLACLFTEHDMDVVFGHADRILVMNRGSLIAEGDAASVRANTAVREVYLGSGETSGGH